METIKKYLRDAAALEERLAEDIARLSEQLEPFPEERDEAALDEAWTRASFSRGKLARFLRGGLQDINASGVTGSYQRHQVRLARKDFKTMKTRLNLWTRLRPVVAAQLLARRRELIVHDFRSSIELKILDHVMNLFFDSMHRLANPKAHTQSDAAKSLGCHRDIPLPMDRFSLLIGAAHRLCLAQQRPRPLRFLDVGSGGGTKVLAAATCFEFCDGLEYDEFAVTEGRRFLEMLQPERCKLIQGDALQFSDYGSYDVIYFYRPLKHTPLNAELEDRIISQARPGTVLLNAGDTCFDDLAERGVQELMYQVFVTGMTGDQARELVNIAEYMGPMVPPFRSPPVTGEGYWRPLLEVSARNGYFI